MDLSKTYFYNEQFCLQISDNLAFTSIWTFLLPKEIHYNDVIMSMIASQITSLTIVYSTVY